MVRENGSNVNVSEPQYAAYDRRAAVELTVPAGEYVRGASGERVGIRSDAFRSRSWTPAVARGPAGYTVACATAVATNL